MTNAHEEHLRAGLISVGTRMRRQNNPDPLQFISPCSRVFGHRLSSRHRTPVSEKRLSLTTQGKVRYELKTPYRDGTTHVIFEPVDFIARLTALVPKPRVNLTRYHGVFAPNNRFQ